jgi:hypothetical protein
MGLLSSVKKFGKSIIHGVHHVFEKVMGMVGKFMNSAWGKGLMLAVGIFTMGTALAAGYTAWAAAPAGDFIGALGQGASAMVNSLTGGALGTAAPTANATAATATAAADPADVLNMANAGGGVSDIAQGMTGLAPGTPGVVGGLESAAGPVGAGTMDLSAATPAAAHAATSGVGVLSQAQGFLRGVGSGAGVRAPIVGAEGSNIGEAAGGLLGRAARGVANYASTAGGGQIVGNVLKGYGTGQMESEKINQQQRQAKRFEDLWANTQIYNQPGFGAATVPAGFGQRADQLNRYGANVVNTPQTTNYSGGSRYASPPA